MTEAPDSIPVTVDGETLQVVELLTGRGFITGKSGSGKSNTASVIAEELLAEGLPLVIVDTDGEYFGLKERYELLHVGADETCDAVVGPGDAEALVEVVLDENVPLILDVSGYLDRDEANALLEKFARALFVGEKRRRKPLLLFVEEVHEYLPEQGSLGSFGELLIQIAKRGRKRGLGLCGMSQRPAAVDKDFITQCDWLAWHRLTWETDTAVAARILPDAFAADVDALENGEAVLVTDWDEQIRKVRFRRKETFDAGATPDLEEYDPPETRSVDAALTARFAGPDDADVTDADEPTARTDGAGVTEADDPASVADVASAAEGGSAGRRAGRTRPDRSPAGRPDLLWELSDLLAFVVRSAYGRAARGLRSLTDRSVARASLTVRRVRD